MGGKTPEPYLEQQVLASYQEHSECQGLPLDPGSEGLGQAGEGEVAGGLVSGSWTELSEISRELLSG